MPPVRPRLFATLTALFCSALACAQGKASAGTGVDWPTYGGDPGGQRFSNATQINRDNVSKLHPVWTYHTHALESGYLAVHFSNFEATPILFNGTLYLTTPFDRVIALNPETGDERWTFDPKMRKDLIAASFTSRGVAAWQGKESGACASRIFVATLDARLIALDATDGKPCDSFGNHGQVDLTHNVPTRPDAPYQFFGNTSPATIVGDVVIVGSVVGDNQAVSVEPGIVRGYDVRTGQLLWTWDPLPWAMGRTPRTGAGNAWGVIAADPAHNLVFVPTGSASPDFWGGFRIGDDKDANSLVALDARTGKKVWAFQLVHHDVWDYDVASEPLLFDFQNRIPAVAIAAKTGIVFVFNRLTGEPLWPIEERSVPQNGAPGERLSPTQPFSALPPLNPLSFDTHQLTGLSGEDLRSCSAKLAKLRYDGIFTPIGVERGTLQYPGSLGGVNWASMSFDPTTGILYANTNRSAFEIQLIAKPSRWTELEHKRRFWFGLAMLALLVGALARRKPVLGFAFVALAFVFLAASFYFKPLARFTSHRPVVSTPERLGELDVNEGTPYRIFRRFLQNDIGHPCTPEPWGATTALNLNTGKKEWEEPLGTLVEGQRTGTVNFGAPVVTAGGLIFTAGTSQPLLFAIDKATGKQVWQGNLPVSAFSTPMTYEIHGRQFVVVDAGGHGGLNFPLGDSVVAFALK